MATCGSVTNRATFSAQNGGSVTTDPAIITVSCPRLVIAKTADVPGLQLLGADQMKHLNEWVRDWRGAEMKAVISQTIFTAMATHHGNEGRLVADYDTNAKMNPPLRSADDVAAIVEGISDGTIDVIASDHAPHRAVTPAAAHQAGQRPYTAGS